MGVKIIRNGKEESHSIVRDLVGLVFLFLSIYTIISLLSYHPTDPSFFTVTNSGPQNWGGIIGSYYSALLLQVFGAAVPAIAVLFIFFSIGTFRKITRLAWVVMSANNLFLLVATCALLGVMEHPFEFRDDKFSYGGVIGAYFSGFFKQYLSLYGTALLACFLLFFAISLSTKKSIRQICLLCWLVLNRTTSNIAKNLQSATGQLKGVLKKLRWASIRNLLTAPPKLLIATFQRFLGKLNSLFSFFQRKKNLEPAISVNQPVFPEEKLKLSDLIKKHRPASEPIEASDENESIAIEPPKQRQDSLASGFLQRLQTATNRKAQKTAEKLNEEIDYELPSLHFLDYPEKDEISFDKKDLIAKSKLLEKRLSDFRVEGKVTAVKPGPVVTMYEFKPGPGIKVNSITNLSDDLALALSAQSVRIVAPIPGRDVVGIEIPNSKRQKVVMREIVGAEVFSSEKYEIPIAIGKDILGEPMVADLKKMPHLLVAGATGSGKSVFVNTVICSLLYRFTPEQLRLILVDPKQLELNHYNHLPHLLLPVVFEPKKASQALKWAVNEMEERYRLIARSGMRDVNGFNQKLEQIGSEELTALIRKAPDGMELYPEGIEATHLPKIVIVIDELADLMMTAKSEVETSICRLAQKARAAGIHLILATQRPSVDVVTGLIKANLPSRISFRLSSKNDSRTIFDSMGAERLVGNGDMLFMPPGESTLVRMHGAYISETEVEAIADFWREQSEPEYREAEILIDEEEEHDFDLEEDSDALFEDALDIAFSSGSISASMLQRRLRVGYNRAARMVELMEAKGIVGPAEGSKPREVLVERD